MTNEGKRRTRLVVGLAAALVLAATTVLVRGQQPTSAATAGRLQGATRYETAVAVSKAGFPNSAAAVYVARGDGFADALAAGALSDGPILLVPAEATPAAVPAEVQRLNPGRVIALGGPAAVSDGKLAELANGRPTARLAGANRYDTAVAVSQAGFPNGAPTVYLARGDGFADALSGGALTGGPMLLVPSDGTIPSSVSGEVNRLNPTRVVALGGPGAVPQSTLETLGSGRTTDRLQGNNRYETSVAISKAGFPSGASKIYLARGDGFADALAAGTLTGGPILLVPSDGSIPSVVSDEGRRLNAGEVLALGGPNAVPDSTLQSIATGTPPPSGSTTTTPGAGAPPNAFTEQFTWKGDPAAKLGAGGTTVWWNADNWDIHADTHPIAIAPDAPPPFPYGGQHVDIHKATSAADTDAGESNATNVPGGDGSPGVGVMHLDYQGIMSARLRNPMLISASQPGIVTFYAPKFVTTGHWWEVAISPTTSVDAGEYTAVPGRQPPEALNDPINGQPDGGGATNGPGHHEYLADSVNVISTGWPDGPTCDGSGWHARYAATRASGGQAQEFVTPAGSIDKLVTVDPNDHSLVHWRITYLPNHVTLQSDFADTGTWETRGSWDVTIPWSEAYVHLLYAAYQADHHPSPNCGFGVGGTAQAQETQWKEVVIGPVKYTKTSAFPKTTAERRAGGWMSFDTRDSQRRGDGQPNAGSYDKYSTYAWCSLLDPNGGIRCGDPARAKTTIPLHVTLASGDLANLAKARVVAELRFPGTASVDVNGHPAGTFAAVPADTPPSPSGSAFDQDAWVTRAVEVDPTFLVAGDNTITVRLSPGTLVYLDRVQLELDTSR